MGKSLDKIINDILNLPYDLRAYLAEKLIESLDADANFEISDEWKNEIQRRCKEIDEGQAVLIDGDEVFSKAFDRLK